VVESYLLSDVMVVGLVAGLVWALLAARRSRVWRDAGREILRRRPIALAVFLVYVGIGVLDSLAWVSGSPGGVTAGGDTVSLHKPRSAIDRLFPDASFREKSYSAPLADREFLGGAPLRHPGRHLLGTDILGRDVLYQTLKGARVALLVGGFTTLIVIPLALLFGVLAGYFGGRTDDAIFFLISTLASMPNLLLLIALIMVLGRGPVQVCVALGVTGWVSFARIVRGETLKLRELDYVQAARALGASDLRILLRHIVPNLMHLVVITFVLTFSGFVLSEAVLSWLTIGIDGSWGRMIDQARDELAREPIIWWNLVSASLALFGLILAVNLLGDAVRDILDPRTRRERA
jgi:peptide/nickel transport system permease protein